MTTGRPRLTAGEGSSGSRFSPVGDGAAPQSLALIGRVRTRRVINPARSIRIHLRLSIVMGYPGTARNVGGYAER